MAQIHPLQIFLASLSGWMSRKQGQVLAYLIEENRVLEEQLRGRRLRLASNQRRRLAAKGKRLGRRLLGQIATIVTPDTIMSWADRPFKRPIVAGGGTAELVVGGSGPSCVPE